MKTRLSLIILFLLVLPLVLTACGNGDADTAKKYIEAIDDNDKEEAAKHICDENKDKLLNDSFFDAKDLKCDKDGDGVKCTFTSEQSIPSGDGSGSDIYTADAEMTFKMKDGKVCEIKSLIIDGIDYSGFLELDLGQ